MDMMGFQGNFDLGTDQIDPIITSYSNFGSVISMELSIERSGSEKSIKSPDWGAVYWTRSLVLHVESSAFKCRTP